MSLPTLCRFLFGLLFGALAFAALAQQTAAPGLPPDPTPTPMYPGARVSSSYPSATGVPLYAWQSLYLPIYLHLYRGDVDTKTGKPSEMPVSVQISIRNTDPRAQFQITSARYYNAEGALQREFIPRPQTVPPLGTYEIRVPRPTTPGESSASFIIEWSAERPINEPLVEALHVDTRDSRTQLFVTAARPMQTR